MEIARMFLVIAKKIGAVASIVQAGLVASLFTFFAFPFIRFTKRPTERVLLLSKKALYGFVFFSLVEIESNWLAANYGVTLEYAFVGVVSGLLAGLSSAVFWMVMVAHDPKWKKNVERDAKYYALRASIGGMIGAMALCTLLYGKNADEIAVIRAWEFIALSFGICLPLIAGKEFVKVSLQIRPWLT